MRRYSCDVCGKELRDGEDHRFVLKMEAFAAADPAELTEADLEEDHLEEIAAQELPAQSRVTFRLPLPMPQDCRRTAVVMAAEVEGIFNAQERCKSIEHFRRMR